MSIVLLDEFKDYARDQVSVDDAILQGALDAATIMAQEYCAREFVVAGASSARSYTPATADSDVLRIHDCTTITSVVENGVTLSASAYQAEPLNRLSWSGASRPIEQLRRNSNVWYHNYGQLTVVVTATWGWLTAIPAPATEAVKIIAKDIVQQRNNNSGVAGFGEFGAVRVRMNPYAIDLLKPLRRAEAFGIA